MTHNSCIDLYLQHNLQGAWVVQWVKHATLGFHLDLDFSVLFSGLWDLAPPQACSAWSLHEIVYLPLPLPLLLVFSLSLSKSVFLKNRHNILPLWVILHFYVPLQQYPLTSFLSIWDGLSFFFHSTDIYSFFTRLRCNFLVILLHIVYNCLNFNFFSSVPTVLYLSQLW